MLKSSPRDRIQRYYRGKSLSMVGSRGMVSSRKKWCCATGAKLDTCLARRFTEDSNMSLTEQSDTPGKSVAPVQPESSFETQPSTESQ